MRVLASIFETLDFLFTPCTYFYPSAEEAYTVEEAIEKLGFGFFQVLVTLFSGLLWVRYMYINVHVHVYVCTGPLLCMCRLSSIA